jgi:hypothetical protein
MEIAGPGYRTWHKTQAAIHTMSSGYSQQKETAVWMFLRRTAEDVKYWYMIRRSGRHILPA